MLVFLSPAKTLDVSQALPTGNQKPKFSTHTIELVNILKGYNQGQLKKLMGISDKLAELNYERFQDFSLKYTQKNSKSAIRTFKGDVYVGLKAEDLSDKELAFAEKHVRILSGLYGILKPLDKIQPYRLEMGTALKNPKGKNLYEFWREILTAEVNKNIKKLKNPFIVNLASKEYFSALNRKEIEAEIIDIGFKEYRGDKLQFVSFNAKKARGIMTRYIVKNRILDIESLKAFDLDGYGYDESLSSPSELLFTRTA